LLYFDYILTDFKSRELRWDLWTVNPFCLNKGGVIYLSIYFCHAVIARRIRFMVFNATFNNISVLLVEEAGVPRENCRPAESH